MQIPAPAHLSRPLARGTVIVLALLAAGCGAGSDSASDGPTTTAEKITATTAETTTTVARPDPAVEKVILLDGFIGVAIPVGWSVTKQQPPVPSSDSPAETDLDPDALVQSLIVSPDAAPRGASFALVHYEHSDRVPGLDQFADAAVELLGGDGSRIGVASDVTIGGQDGYLYQVTSASGANGVLVVFESGGEYFFVLSIASDSAYAADAATMLTSVSFEPAALSS